MIFVYSIYRIDFLFFDKIISIIILYYLHYIVCCIMDFSTTSMLLAGIALFLFGMMFFEETIHNAFGNSIKDSIKKYASNLFKSIGIGAVSTSILQSSTVVIMLML